MSSASDSFEDPNASSRPPSLLPQFAPVALNSVRGHGHSHAPSHGHSHVTGPSVGHAAHGQPGVSRVMQFQLPMPLAAAAMNAGQSFVINVDNPSVASGLGSAMLGQPASSSSGAVPTDAGSSPEPPHPGSLSSVKDVIKSLEGTLPFLILVFAKIMYDHRLGILVFVAMYGTFFHANSSLRKLIMQQDVHNSLDYLGNLVWIIGFLAANILFVYYVFDDQQLYRSLYFCLPEVGDMSLWNLLWVVGTTDFIIKYFTILLKALITALPRQVLPFRRKGKFYMLVEILSQFYRSLVPIMPWVFFLKDDSHGGKWFSILLLVLYIVFKGADLYGRLKELRKGLRKFLADLSYGSSPSEMQLQSYDNQCPMCLDKFQEPIVLSCKHIFCEECISKWFNQEHTCPMCRANVIDHPQWRDGVTSGSLQLW